MLPADPILQRRLRTGIAEAGVCGWGGRCVPAAGGSGAASPFPASVPPNRSLLPDAPPRREKAFYISGVLTPTRSLRIIYARRLCFVPPKGKGLSGLGRLGTNKPIKHQMYTAIVYWDGFFGGGRGVNMRPPVASDRSKTGGEK